MNEYHVLTDHNRGKMFKQILRIFSVEVGNLGMLKMLRNTLIPKKYTSSDKKIVFFAFRILGKGNILQIFNGVIEFYLFSQNFRTLKKYQIINICPLFLIFVQNHAWLHFLT
jgi:hypothetical protein